MNDETEKQTTYKMIDNPLKPQKIPHLSYCTAQLYVLSLRVKRDKYT